MIAMTTLQKFEGEQLAKLAANTKIPEFAPGDTVKVNVKVREGERERVQAFEGVVIARKHGGLRETFTVRKISFGIGVERIFPIHSPFVERIEVVRSGKIRRAKLYYLRKLSGRAAKLTEREALSVQTSEPVGSVVESAKAGAEPVKAVAGAGRTGERTPS